MQIAHESSNASGKGAEPALFDGVFVQTTVEKTGFRVILTVKMSLYSLMDERTASAVDNERIIQRSSLASD